MSLCIIGDGNLDHLSKVVTGRILLWKFTIIPFLSFFFFFPLGFLFYFLLYNIVFILPYINMNPPWVYTHSPS